MAENQQEEEREVLSCIFEGDENFKQISDTCFQYKYTSETDDRKSFIVELSWPENYPEELAVINLDTFYNNALPDDLKSEIKEQLIEQATPMIGEAMTYSIFDWMKENSGSFLERIPDPTASIKVIESGLVSADVKSVKVKKEQLSKAQKRKLTERTNFKGEHERGWNWVDVVKHLCQTGGHDKDL